MCRADPCPHRKTHCLRGHEIAKFGRDTGGVCRGCRLIYQRKYSAKRLSELHAYKLWKGCERCGYRKSGKALDFHHKDPTTKALEIGRSLSVRAERTWAEIAKCEVLCRNCHAELHAGEH